MVSINGMACHETGCPNERKLWDASEGTWYAEGEDDSDTAFEEYLESDEDEA
jgi:hypothetical protein